MPAAIEFDSVTKVFRRPFSKERISALADVSFQVDPGEVCAFLGPNGAGKTTSINILMGFLFSDAGAVRVLGHPPGDVRAKRQIGLLPENYAFYPHLTARKLLEFHAALAGVDGPTAQTRIPGLLATVRLSDHAGQKIGRYSRGMLQRLGLAQALLNDPQLLVLDEPTSGLDPAGRKDVRELLLTLKSEGRTVFVSSHILAEVEQFCDRVVIIDRGRLVQAGPLDALLTRGTRVEILADRLPEELAPALLASGASIARDLHGVRLTVDLAAKREVAEKLWASGCDVVSIQPVRDSLETLFLQLVGRPEEVQ
jgi:ABC-2 type transport system ATP-binding protein